MSQYSSVRVVFAENLSEEEATRAVEALYQMKHVVEVQMEKGDMLEAVARARLKLELTEKLHDLVRSL